MTEPMNINRLTDEAFRALVNLAEAKPELWQDPEADFGQALAEIGVIRYAEATGITAADPALAPPERPPRPRADRQALDWSQGFNGMTPVNAADPNLLAWLNHFALHRYGIKRWTITAGANPVNHIRRHWLTENASDIWESSIAGRTWWIAETCRRASECSGGAFTAQQALDHFSENAENYHNSMQFNLMRNPLLLAECIRVLLNEARGISTTGYRQVVRQLNREAGALLPDALSRQQIRGLIVKITEQTMTQPGWVRDRRYLRNRNITRVLSLGAGTQSTVLALMAEQGYGGIPRPDFAIFADTGWEPPAVYEHLEWLKSQLSYEVITVSAGNIKENILAGTNPDGGKFLDLPAFLTEPDGSLSISARQCTRHYKLTPIFRELRERLGLSNGKRAPKDVQVEMWLGISADETARQKPSREEWITNRWPLVEQGYSRAQLYQWFAQRYPERELPRSACIGCPYHSNGEWKHLKERDPKSFAEAVFVDKALREMPQLRELSKGTAYLHRSRQPLDEVDFSGTKDYTEAMQEECEGLCGI